MANNGITVAGWKAMTYMRNLQESFPNGLKVSKTDNPMFFPVDNTYRVGSSEIRALMSNAIAVGTGQTGSAPLYVFCADGVYMLFVDSSGEIAYTNARILSREVCNNARSVTPIDEGIVFTTDRGLMMMAGEQVVEIGAPAEGDVLKYANSQDRIKIAANAFILESLAGLSVLLVDGMDFLTYLHYGSGAIINYNHNMRELIVSNPSKNYSYVRDREGNWSRRTYSGLQYVNNFPTSYRLKARKLYKMDEEGDSSTSLEERKEADNRIFYLSNIIKLDSIGFKSAHRLVVRGYFDVYKLSEFTLTSDNIITTDENGNVVSCIQIQEIIDDEEVLNADMIAEWSALSVGDIIRINKTDYKITEADTTNRRWTLDKELVIASGQEQQYSIPSTLGLYVFGSYDGRKFGCLGWNEKKGLFTDFGCDVSRTDMRYFRICLAGQVTGKTRIDYMEISHSPSVLNTKIR